MKTVEVDAAVRYNIVIDKGILPKSGDMIKEVTSAERVAVITDDTVDKLYSDVVMKSLSDAGFETFKFVFPHGEKSKNISTFSSILEFLPAFRSIAVFPPTDESTHAKSVVGICIKSMPRR